MTAAVDRWGAYSNEVGPCATDVTVVTPSDTVDLPYVTRWIRAQVAGTVSVTTKEGSHVSLNFLAGETRAVRVSRIWATGTTATGIEAMV